MYLDLKNFDVSDLKDTDENANMPNSDDWITVSKPKPQKNQKGKGQKGKNNTIQTTKASSFVNICKNFQDFLGEARGRKNQIYDPSTLFSSISHLYVI